MKIIEKLKGLDASSGGPAGWRQASQADIAASYNEKSYRKLNIHTRAPHSDTIIVKCNGPCIGMSMHMPTRRGKVGLEEVEEAGEEVEEVVLDVFEGRVAESRPR